MEHKSTGSRHFGCFSASVILHSLLISCLTLAPAMMLKKGVGDGEGTTIDVTVVGDSLQEIPAQEIPVQEVAPEPVAAPVVAEAPKPEPAPVVAPAQPEPVVVAKPKPVKKAETKAASVETAPATVEPQAVVEVGETMNEETTPTEEPVVVTAQEEAPKEDQPEILPPPVIAEEPKPEPRPAQEPVQEPVHEVAAQEPTPEPTPAAVAQGASGEGQSSPGGEQGQSPASSQGSTQNFLSLKQMPGNKPPHYTREMRLNRLEGRGQLVYFVTKDGRVTDIKLTQSTGQPELDRAAIEAFSKYRFYPGQEGYTVHNFEFTLKGPAEADAGRLRTTYK